MTAVQKHIIIRAFQHGTLCKRWVNIDRLYFRSIFAAIWFENSYVATVPPSKDLECMSVGLVTGITHEIFEVRNIRNGTEKFLRTLTRCRGIKWGGQFDIGNMWSAASPSHWNRLRNCDLGVTSEGRCEIIQHIPRNFIVAPVFFMYVEFTHQQMHFY